MTLFGVYSLFFNFIGERLVETGLGHLAFSKKMYPQLLGQNSEVRAVSFPPLVGNGFSVLNLISYSIKITEAFRLDYVVNLKVNKRKGVISK